MSEQSVLVQAPAKINIDLAVGPVGRDGFHPIATVFQAVDLHDHILLTPADELTLTISGPYAEAVPADDRNLAWQAAMLIATRTGRSAQVRLEVEKNIPVAAGLAGGSADAAGVLVGLNTLWDLGLTGPQLEQLAAELGSDVAFAVRGRTALGTGRGEKLAAAPAVELHWVLCVADFGLSTPAVYRAFDLAAVTHRLLDCGAVLAALAARDLAGLSQAMRNDLQPAALQLAPELSQLLAAGLHAGALTAQVSGSGPTVTLLAADAEHAQSLAADLRGECAAALAVRGNAPGARAVPADLQSVTR